MMNKKPLKYDCLDEDIIDRVNELTEIVQKLSENIVNNNKIKKQVQDVSVGLGKLIDQIMKAKKKSKEQKN